MKSPLRALLLIGYAATDRRTTIDQDLAVWAARKFRDVGPPKVDLLVFGDLPEFRTVFYHRLRTGNLAGRLAAKALQRVVHPVAQLDIATDDIGPGFYISHGYGTIVTAERIGRNFWVHHGVTIGWDYNGGKPTIGDDVFVGTGAAVLGRIHVGDGAKIGANAVVVSDVPPGATAVGVPARSSLREQS